MLIAVANPTVFQGWRPRIGLWIAAIGRNTGLCTLPTIRVGAADRAVVRIVAERAVAVRSAARGIGAGLGHADHRHAQHRAQHQGCGTSLNTLHHLPSVRNGNDRFLITIAALSCGTQYINAENPRIYEHVRRLASEGSRPRLPWSFRLETLTVDPSPVLPILNNLKADDSLYERLGLVGCPCRKVLHICQQHAAFQPGHGTAVAGLDLVDATGVTLAGPSNAYRYVKRFRERQGKLMMKAVPGSRVEVTCTFP
jgi:hypothetical protein